MDVASPPTPCIDGRASAAAPPIANVGTNALATKFFEDDGPSPAGPRGPEHPSSQGEGPLP